jgi:hypothetical protein
MNTEESIKFKTFSGTMVPNMEWTHLMDFVCEHSRTTRVVESAALNMSMVARHALGLKALGGSVGGIITDSVAGWITTATLRTLANNGANVTAFTLSDVVSVNLKSEVEFLKQSDGKVIELKSADQLEGFHSMLLGILDSGLQTRRAHRLIWDHLNESCTPVLSVLPPLSEIGESEPLVYASATLFLGLPQDISKDLKDTLGRSYLCDISLSRHDTDGGCPVGLFSEQPVIQIYQVDGTC